MGDFTWTGLFGLIVVLINGTAFGVWLRTRPRMRELDTASRAADFARLRDEIASQGARIEKLESDVKHAETEAVACAKQVIRSEAKLQAVLAACELLLARMERDMPDAPEIAIVKRLLAQAAADDMGIGDGVRRLLATKDAGK